MNPHPTAFIVDDDDDFRSALGDVLGDEGYIVVEASDGRQALRLLDTLKPDVMLIDLLMPVMNGWSLFANIEKRADLRTVPVVFVSAVPQMAPGGGSMILKKPLDLPALMKLLDALRPEGPSSEIPLSASPRTSPAYHQTSSKRRS